MIAARGLVQLFSGWVTAPGPCYWADVTGWRRDPLILREISLSKGNAVRLRIDHGKAVKAWRLW